MGPLRQVGILLLFLWAEDAASTHLGCYVESNANGATFQYSGGLLAAGDRTPDKCFEECQRQGLTSQATEANPLVVGIGLNYICYCGFKRQLTTPFGMTEAATVHADLKCSQDCDGSSAGAEDCGGPHGAISLHEFPTLSTAGIGVSMDLVDEGRIPVDDPNGDRPAGTVKTGTEVYLEVHQGQYKCSAYPPEDADLLECRYDTADTSSIYYRKLPELTIMVDWGDGSGARTWSETNLVNLWKHKYSRPGSYVVTYRSEHIYDKSVELWTYDVTVVEPIVPAMQEEVRCPNVVDPGEYFTCSVDMPIGSGLSATITMTDDVDGGMAAEFLGPVKVPEYWYKIPGKVFPYSSWNGPSQLDTTNAEYDLAAVAGNQAAVLKSTFFGAVSNITQVEFVPMSAGKITIEVVYPVCDGDKVWCAQTELCQDVCASGYGFEDTAKGECSASTFFCSAEETCDDVLDCPVTVPGEAPVSYRLSPNTPLALQDIEVSADEVGVTKVVTLEKRLWTASEPGYEEHLDGLKIHDEKSWGSTSPAGYYLAIRCEDTSNCAQVAIEPSPLGADTGDIDADFAATTYTVTANGQGTYLAQVRPVLYEDRIVDVGYRFFCDRATEKTVRLEITDALGTVLNTAKADVSCQYPIVSIADLSETNVANTNDNSWIVDHPFPTAAEVDAGEEKRYEASLWVRSAEEITFHVQFARGSHVQVSWEVTAPTAESESDDECLTAPKTITGNPGDYFSPYVEETGAGSPCVFPFRHLEVLYYGCTEYTHTTGEVLEVCATSTDDNFDGQSFSWCNANCHRQRPRPEEISGGSLATETATDDEDGTSRTFISALETELTLKRAFSTTGKIFTVTLTAENMHNEEDQAVMIWHVLCANPINGRDWLLSYEPFIAENERFDITIGVVPDVALPTMPTIFITEVNGEQTIAEGNVIEVDNSSLVTFYVQDGGSAPDCSFTNPDCLTEIKLEDVGMNDNMNSGAGADINLQYGDSLVLSIPAFSVKGSHGFSVHMVNGISTLRIDYSTQAVIEENIQLLDPGPAGTGEWVTIAVPKWEYNWVETFERFDGGAVEFRFQYTLPDRYGSIVFNCSYVNPKWYLPASAHPYFNVGIYSGTARRIQYMFNNTDPDGYSPPPCFIDWPTDTYTTATSWNVGHCPEMEEGSYAVTVGVWNPIDGWLSSAFTQFEILEEIGPIHIDDYQIISDVNDTKAFNITLERAGSRSCIVVDWGDGSDLEYWGDVDSCRIRNSTLSASAVQAFDHEADFIATTHVYRTEGEYEVLAFGYDERHYDEAMLPVTIFGFPCQVPVAYIPENHTTWEQLAAVPTIERSKGFLKQAISSLECNVTVNSTQEWSVYSVSLIEDGQSQAGQREVLTHLNGTLSNTQGTLLNVPALAFDYGLHKLVFKLEVLTGKPGLRLYREAYTYFMVIKSDLEPILLEGSITKVSRGWEQDVVLTPGELSLDPDYPEDKNFTFEWFCRVVAPEVFLETYPETEGEGDDEYPVFNETAAKPLPARSDPYLINPPPGCFGEGPGPLKTSSGSLTINTAQFITYSLTYEILLVLRKDTRKAKVKIEVEVFSIPLPIAAIECASTCFPTFGGVFLNPTSRVAMRGSCVEECDGTQGYLWEISRPDGLNVTEYFCPDNVLFTTTTAIPETSATARITTITDPIEPPEEQVVSMLMKTDTESIVISGVEDALTGIPSDIVTTIEVITEAKRRRKRRKRQLTEEEETALIQQSKMNKRMKRQDDTSTVTTPQLPHEDCSWVYADGSRYATDGAELAIQQEFFDIQPYEYSRFQLKLTVSMEAWDGLKYTTVYGTSYINLLINRPPENGTCTLDIEGVDPDDGSVIWNGPALTGRTLVDDFKITCEDWVDPDDHQITKYVFIIVEETEGGTVVTPLYSGPNREAIVIFPVGEFHLYAEIHEEAEAFAVYDINLKLPIILPEEEEYRAFQVEQKQFTETDEARVSQILTADASVRKYACWYDIQCMLAQDNPDLDLSNLEDLNVTDSQQQQIDALILLVTQENTDAINEAKDSLQFTSTDQLAQGASVLNSITSNLDLEGPLANTLDMAGREAAVSLIEEMAEAFKEVEETDPANLKEFVTSITSSVASISNSLSNILYTNDPSQITLSDFENAADMKYDTYIQEGDVDSGIDDLDKAKQINAFRLTRISAVEQVQKMVELVDDIAETTIINMVEGEEMSTSTPNGVSMIMTKLGGSATVGRDTDGDGEPDRKLRYELDDEAVVQFPLGFCPSARDTGLIKKKGCKGRWGFVFKCWETITAPYPPSARNLNRVTKQIDIDLYDDKGGWVDVSGMAVNIDIIIPRMKSRDPVEVSFTDEHTVKVNLVHRLKALKKRNKWPMIYHHVEISRPYSTLNVQIKLETPETTRMLVLVRHAKLPTWQDCDIVRVLRRVQLRDDNFIDVFIDKEEINNKTGQWYVGVMSLSESVDMTTILDNQTCAGNGMELSWFSEEFHATEYYFQAYTAGCYSFNKSTEVWESIGITVYNTTKVLTACGLSHLTSFASGWFPQVNKIDFEFVFAAASFQDNLTIYMALIISFTFYLIAMIWAICKDRKDIKNLAVPVLLDNDPREAYFYEIIVETGPLASHATTSNIKFILDGDDGDTGERCFENPERNLFGAGAQDAFLLSVGAPLGELNYIRVWTDNSGLQDNSAWYLMSIEVTDCQTGVKYRFVHDNWVACDCGTYEDDVIIHGTEAGSVEDTYYLLKAGAGRKMADDHAWFSVFSRPPRSRFSRAQRVTVCMAMLYLFFLANAMFYENTAGRVSDPYFSLGVLQFDAESIGVGIVSTLVVFPPVILAVLLFKKSGAMFGRENRIDIGLKQAMDAGRFDKGVYNARRTREFTEVEKKRIGSWPGVLKFIAWLICLACIGGGGFLVLSYGLQFGNDKTYQWIVSMISAFFSSLLITQPLKIFCLAMCIGYCFKKPKFNDDHAEADEPPPHLYYDQDKMDRELQERTYRPPRKRYEPDFYAWLVHLKNQEMEMRVVVRDMTIYFIYVVIIFIISYGNRDPNAYLAKEAMQKAIIFGGTSCNTWHSDDSRHRICKEDEVPIPYVNFDKVRDVNEWYGWMNLTLVPYVRVQPWYNGAQPYGLRGYLEDRVNRLIGYAIVRQIREEMGTCRTAKVIRDVVETCTGDGGQDVEETRDFCLGWQPQTFANCTQADEFEYTPASDIDAISFDSAVRKYGGGGFIFPLKGYIEDMEDRFELLKRENWVDNRTRALIVEFSVYNAQVNMFTLVTCVTEFVGGGTVPYYNIDVFRLFPNLSWFGNVVTFAEVMFVASIFYYIVNLSTLAKRQGCSKFIRDTGNVLDCLTVILSIIAMALYVAKLLVTVDLTQQISDTRGNSYLRLSYVQLLNRWYDYMLSVTVFTSTIKFTKLLSFAKAFMQIMATMRLCFKGLTTFSVEFFIVFCAFSAFFFFVLKNDLENFRDFIRTLENTMAMSIGKFNFTALRAADEMAAWIFFIFSLSVNMVLINMMIAIINMAFEEIKENEKKFQSRFQLTAYVKKFCREVVGLDIAQPINVKYLDQAQVTKLEEEAKDETEINSQKFSDKTSALLNYVQNTYLSAGIPLDEEELDKVNGKLKLDKEEEIQMANIGFDALFGDGKVVPPEGGQEDCADEEKQEEEAAGEEGGDSDDDDDDDDE